MKVKKKKKNWILLAFLQLRCLLERGHFYLYFEAVAITFFAWNSNDFSYIPENVRLIVLKNVPVHVYYFNTILEICPFF